MEDARRERGREVCVNGIRIEGGQKEVLGKKREWTVKGCDLIMKEEGMVMTNNKDGEGGNKNRFDR